MRKKSSLLLVFITVMLLCFISITEVFSVENKDIQWTEEEILSMARWLTTGKSSQLQSTQQQRISGITSSAELVGIKTDNNDCGTPVADILNKARFSGQYSQETTDYLNFIFDTQDPWTVHLNIIDGEDITLTFNQHYHSSNGHFILYYCDSNCTVNSVNHSTTLQYVETIAQRLEHAWDTLLNAPYSFREPVDNEIIVQIYDIPGANGYTWHSDDITIRLDNHLSTTDEITTVHELFHDVQFAYDPDEDGWMIEGTARWIQDAVYDDNNTYARSFDTTCNEDGSQCFMDNPDRTLTNLQYEAVLFWKYFSEQYTTQTHTDNEPYVGVDVIRSLWEEAGEWFTNGTEAVENVAATTFNNIFENWVIANYAKDLYDGDPTADTGYAGLYDYMEDDEASYDQIATLNSPGVDISKTSVTYDNQIVNAWGADYWEFNPSDEVDSIKISLDGSGYENNLGYKIGYNPSYQILRINQNDEIEGGILKSRGDANNNWSLTFRNLNYKKIVIIVAGLQDGGNYTLTVTPINLQVNVMPSGVASPVNSWDSFPYSWPGNNLELWGNVQYDGAGTLTFTWDFGDGFVATGTVTNRNNIAVNHAYIAGSWIATLTVTDGTSSDSDTVYIDVVPQSLEVKTNLAIQRALKYLYMARQTWGVNGCNTYYWNGDRWEGSTGLAVLAFEDHGHRESNDHDKDIYAETVEKGLDAIYAMLRGTGASNSGNSDSDINNNGRKVYEGYTGGNNYENGILAMTIAGTATPNAIVRSCGDAEVRGKTYKTALEDMVDYIAYGQNDTYSWREGGWRYGANYGDSDNSVSQWPALGLAAAQDNFSINAPSWVKTRLQNWLNYSQCSNGGFGYTSPNNWCNIAKTGAGIIEMNYAGGGGNQANAINFIATNWGSTSYDYGNIGDHYAMYAVKKGLQKAIKLMPAQMVFIGRALSVLVEDKAAPYLVSLSWRQALWSSHLWLMQGLTRRLHRAHL